MPPSPKGIAGVLEGRLYNQAGKGPTVEQTTDTALIDNKPESGDNYGQDFYGISVADPGRGANEVYPPPPRVFFCLSV